MSGGSGRSKFLKLAHVRRVASYGPWAPQMCVSSGGQSAGPGGSLRDALCRHLCDEARPFAKGKGAKGWSEKGTEEIAKSADGLSVPRAGGTSRAAPRSSGYSTNTQSHPSKKSGCSRQRALPPATSSCPLRPLLCSPAGCAFI